MGPGTSPSRSSSPCVGINSELSAHATVFHVQTEDLGPKHRSVVTHVFVAGRVMANKRTPYPQDHSDVPFERRIIAIMRAQHDETMRALEAGALYDDSDESQ